MMPVTHTQLVNKSAKWLKKHTENIIVPNCSFVIIEQKTTANEIADVIGFCSWASVKIEAKISVPDFKKEAKKKFKIREDSEMGNFRYFITPVNLIAIEDVPEKWGLLYFENDKITIAKKAITQNGNLISERSLLLTK